MSESNDYNTPDITPEQALEMAKKSGIELTDEQLEQISGGGIWESGKRKCPKCGSDKVVSVKLPWVSGTVCLSCGFQFK